MSDLFLMSSFSRLYITLWNLKGEGRILFLLGILSIVSLQAQAQFNSFTFEVSKNTGKITQDIQCAIYGDSLVVGIVPYQVTNFNLVASFTTSADIAEVSLNNLSQQSGISSNDFSQEVIYKLTSTPSGNLKFFKVRLIYTGLPVVYVQTENSSPIVSKEDYLNGQIKIYPNSSDPVFNAAMQVRGRGNSTWEMPKKPYKIKLNTKAAILGMPSDKEWVLLANYSDKTLLRNALAFEASQRFGLVYQPRSRFVELILNGEYMGNYQLCEQIKVAKNRVDIKEMDANDETDDKISGGYLLEADFRHDEDFWFKTRRDITFTIKSPDEITNKQLSYIQNYIQSTENALLSSSLADPEKGYTKYLDVQSVINWYWVNELMKTTDAVFVSSVFVYKNRDEKLKFGPVWDFDGSSGNTVIPNLDKPEGWWIRSREAVWINRLFTDPVFKALAYKRWNELKENEIKTLISYLEAKALELNKSQQQNFKRWPILNTLVWPNSVATGSYTGEISFLKNWLTKRIDWIDQQINNPELKPFKLLYPESKKLLQVYNRRDSIIQFKWQASDPEVSYQWNLMKTTIDGDLTLLSYVSNNSGKDTTISVSQAKIDSVLYRQGINKGDTIQLKWNVSAANKTRKLTANESFPITFIRKKWLTPFDLLLPKDSTLITYSSEAPLDSITFSWQLSQFASSYKFYLMDVKSKEILYQSVNKSNHSTFHFSQAIQQQIHEQLTNEENVEWKWQVRAFEEGDSIKSSHDFSVRFDELVTGLEENSDKAFTIYPNPGNGNFYFVLNSKRRYSKVKVINLAGANVAELSIADQDTFMLSLDHLAKGMYVVQIYTADAVLTKKLVIE